MADGADGTSIVNVGETMRSFDRGMRDKEDAFVAAMSQRREKLRHVLTPELIRLCGDLRTIDDELQAALDAHVHRFTTVFASEREQNRSRFEDFLKSEQRSIAAAAAKSDGSEP